MDGGGGTRREEKLKVSLDIIAKLVKVALGARAERAQKNDE